MKEKQNQSKNKSFQKTANSHKFFIFLFTTMATYYVIDFLSNSSTQMKPLLIGFMMGLIITTFLYRKHLKHLNQKTLTQNSKKESSKPTKSYDLEFKKLQKSIESLKSSIASQQSKETLSSRFNSSGFNDQFLDMSIISSLEASTAYIIPQYTDAQDDEKTLSTILKIKKMKNFFKDKGHTLKVLKYAPTYQKNTSYTRSPLISKGSVSLEFPKNLLNLN